MFLFLENFEYTKKNKPSYKKDDSGIAMWSIPRPNFTFPYFYVFLNTEQLERVKLLIIYFRTCVLVIKYFMTV